MSNEIKLSEILEDSGFLDYDSLTGEIPDIDYVNLHRGYRLKYKNSMNSAAGFEFLAGKKLKVYLEAILQIIDRNPSFTGRKLQEHFRNMPELWQDIRDYLKEGIDRGMIVIDERMCLNLTDLGHAYLLAQFGELE